MRDISRNGDGCWVDDKGGSNLAKNEGGSRRRGAFFDRPCSLLLLVLFVLSSTCSPTGSSASSTSTTPTSSLGTLVLSLFLLLGLLLLLLKGRRRTRTLDNAYLLSGLRLVGGVIVACREPLFPVLSGRTSVVT